MIEIINGKVFLDGVETINAELIGYAILDMAENKVDLNSKKRHEIQDTIYLLHDQEQKPRMINAIITTKYCEMFEVISGTHVSNHFEYELSKNKNIF